MRGGGFHPCEKKGEKKGKIKTYKKRDGSFIFSYIASFKSSNNQTTYAHGFASRAPTLDL
jgi:hypothetical protein